ncbi:MAG TPA: hypothetical protein VF453_01235 [Burkholderiaceae bacterium]
MQALQRQRTLAALAIAFAAVATTAAHAAPAPAPAASAAAPAPIDPDKRKAVDRVIADWHPEGAMIAGAQGAVARAFDQSILILQEKHVAPEKIEQARKEMLPEAQKSADKVGALAKASALKNVPTVVAPALAQNFSNDELAKIAAVMEAMEQPAWKKFQQFVPQVNQAMGRKVDAEAGADINKELKAVSETLGNKVRATVGLGN